MPRRPRIPRPAKNHDEQVYEQKHHADNEDKIRCALHRRLLFALPGRLLVKQAFPQHAGSLADEICTDMMAVAEPRMPLLGQLEAVSGDGRFREAPSDGELFDNIPVHRPAGTVHLWVYAVRVL